MNDTKIMDRADRLSRRRARIFPLLGLVLICQQAAFFLGNAEERAADHLTGGAWLILSLVMLLTLATGGALLRPSAVRALMEDGPTRAHRGDAMTLAFIVAVLAALAIYLGLPAIAMTTPEAIQAIVSSGLIAGFIRFGLLERKALA